MPVSADDGKHGVEDQHAKGQPRKPKPGTSMKRRSRRNSSSSTSIRSPGESAAGRAAAGTAESEAAAPSSKCPRAFLQLLPKEAPLDPAEYVPTVSCSKRNKIQTVIDYKSKYEPNNEEQGYETASEPIPGIDNLRAGADRLCLTPAQTRIEESPVAGSAESFGAADNSEDAPVARRQIMQVLKRENERIWTLLDSVQDRVQEIWDSGHRVKITIDAIARRKSPIPIDGLNDEDSKPVAHGDGLEGDATGSASAMASAWTPVARRTSCHTLGCLKWRRRQARVGNGTSVPLAR